MTDDSPDIRLMQIKDMINELMIFTRELEKAYSEDYEELKQRIEVLENRL